MDFRVALIPGDGIGPEIVAEARKVLDAVAVKYGHRFTYETLLMGGCSIDACGVPLTEEAVAAAKASDAVLLGAVGGDVGNSRWYSVCLLYTSFCPVREFIEAELIAFNNAPGQIYFGRPLVFGAYAVFPVVAGNKIPPGIAHDGNLQFSDQSQGILSQALFIGKRAVRLIDAFIDRPPQMFDE